MSFRGRSFRPLGGSRPLGRPPQMRQMPEYLPGHRLRPPMLPQLGRPEAHDNYLMREPPPAFAERDDYRMHERLDRSPKSEYPNNSRREFDITNQHYDEGRNAYSERRHNSPVNSEQRASPVGHRDRHSHKKSGHRNSSEKGRRKAHSPVPPTAVTMDRSTSAVEKAKEMAARTREIISKLGGLKQIAPASTTVPVSDAQLTTTIADEPNLPESSPAAKLNAPEPSTISRLLQNDTLVKYAFSLSLSSDMDVVKNPVKKAEADMSFSSAVSAMEHENQYVYETEKVASMVTKSDDLSAYSASEFDDRAALREEMASFSYKPQETVVRTTVPKVELETKPTVYGYSNNDNASFGSGPGSLIRSAPKAAMESEPPQFGYKEDMFNYPVSKVAEPQVMQVAPQATESLQPKEDADAFAQGYDPTIANILKSIGFNFELSSMMQEKARNEKAQTEAPGFGPTVGVESSYPYTVGKSMMSPTENVQTPIAYEQMAHRYREEHMRQFGEPQTVAPAVKGDIHPTEAAPDLKLKYKLAETKTGRKGGALYEDFSDSDDDFTTTVESAAVAPVVAADTFPASVPAAQQMLFPVASEMMQSAKVSKTANDLNWEHNTQEFIRKLQQPRQQAGRTVTIIPRVEASPPAPASSAFTASDNTSPVGQADHIKMMRTVVPLEELRTIRKTIIINDKGQNSATSSKPDVDVATDTDIRKSIKVERKKTPPTVTPQKLSTEENQNILKEKETPKAAKESDAKQSVVKTPAGRMTSNNSNTNAVENKVSTERQKKIENLLKELENLRRQQNALMRRKKREKDGHKDPIIVENSKLQEEINKQINLLKKLGQQTAGISQTSNKTNVDEKPAMTVSEISDEKSVAKTSASPSPERRVSKSPSHRSTSTDRKAKRRTTKSPERKGNKSPDRRQRRSRSHHSSSSSERQKSPVTRRKRSPNAPIVRDLRTPQFNDVVVQVGSRAVASLRDTRRYRSNRGEDNELKNRNKTVVRPKRGPMKYEYFDGGNHFCRCCNFMSRNVFEHCQHLTSSLHQQNVDPFDKPWLKAAAIKEQQKESPPSSKISVVAARIKGVEFLMATEAFYCSLCNEFMGSSTCAENHFKSETHNEKYNKYLDDNTFYERRLELEKSASSAMMPKGSSLNKLSESQESPGSSTIHNELSAVVEAAKLRAKRLMANSAATMDDEPPQPPLKKSRVIPKSHVREDILTMLDSPASTADSTDASDSKKYGTSHENSDVADGKQKNEQNKSQQANVSVAPSKKAALPFIGKLPKFKLSRNARMSADQNADDKSGMKTGSTAVDERTGTLAAKLKNQQLSHTEVIDMDVDDDSSKSLDTFLTISDESGLGHIVPVVGSCTVGPPTLSAYLLLQHDSPSVTTQSLMTTASSSVTVCSGAAAVTTAVPACFAESVPCSLSVASVASSTASSDGAANCKAFSNMSNQTTSNLLTVDSGSASVASGSNANAVHNLIVSDIVTKSTDLVTDSSSLVSSSLAASVSTAGLDVQRPTSSVDAGNMNMSTGSSKSSEVSLPATQTMQVVTTDDNSKTQDYEAKSDKLGDKVTPVDTTTSNLLPSFTAKLTDLVTKESDKVQMAFGDDFEILDECDAGDAST